MMHHLAVIAAAGFITAIPSTRSYQCNSRKMRLIRIGHSFINTFDTHDLLCTALPTRVTYKPRLIAIAYPLINTLQYSQLALYGTPDTYYVIYKPRLITITHSLIINTLRYSRLTLHDTPGACYI